MVQSAREKEALAAYEGLCWKGRMSERDEQDVKLMVGYLKCRGVGQKVGSEDVKGEFGMSVGECMECVMVCLVRKYIGVEVEDSGRGRMVIWLKSELGG